jgi:DNA-binding CsgD family transcriptional regulator/tetratricopeptide (TPR) repeat protein
VLGPIELTGVIEESFLRRLDELPAETRLLLLVAAAEPLGDPALLWGAAERLGLAGAALEPATREGMLDVGARVRFRHPLVRSAVYRSASARDRRTVHGALAEETNAELEPDRRAWHRAQAADGPDDEVAAELERSAGRAQARGGLAAGAAFWERAAALTLEPARRAERTLAAAQAHLHAGAFDHALAMLARAKAGPLDDFGHARVDLLEAGAAYAQHRDGDAVPLLLRAARQLEALDVRLSRDTYLDAWGAALFAGGLARGGGLPEVSRAVAAAPRPASLRPSDLLVDGFALVFTEGRVAASPLLQRATKDFGGGEAAVEEVLRWGWLATAAAVYIWDFDTCLAAATRGVELARDSGALEVLAVSVNVLSQAVALRGDFETAARLIGEADAVREATGTRVAPYGALVLAALRGREGTACELIDTTIAEASAGGQGNAVQYARWARAVLMNGLGRHEEAREAAVEASDDVPELFVSMWSLSELIEAATRTGEHELGQRALARLSQHVQGTSSAWALGLLARGRALLTDGPQAGGLYRDAIYLLGRTRLRPELARSRLLYGEWLRRTGQDADAGDQLRHAHGELIAIGADAFGDRAGRELASMGAKLPHRRDEPEQLTPQERHIAGLARDGFTNVEIAAKLVLSPRTVEWHLKKVFVKLGVTSRRDLAVVLPRTGE